MTQTINIILEQGADYDTPIQILDDNGDPEDFTGCTGVAQFATDYGATPILTLTTDDGSFTIETGQFVPHIAYTTARAIYAGLYVGDLLIRHANGLIRKARTIVLRVNPTATQIEPPSPSPSPSPAPYGQLNFSIAGNSGLASGVM